MRRIFRLIGLAMEIAAQQPVALLARIANSPQHAVERNTEGNERM